MFFFKAEVELIKKRLYKSTEKVEGLPNRLYEKYGIYLKKGIQKGGVTLLEGGGDLLRGLADLIDSLEQERKTSKRTFSKKEKKEERSERKAERARPSEKKLPFTFNGKKETPPPF